MRRYVCIFVLVLSIFLLYACARTNNTSKEDPVILTTGHQDNPAAGVTVQAADSPEAESSRPDTGAGAEKTPVIEQEDTDEVSPQISAEASINTEQKSASTDDMADETASPPSANTTPDTTAEQEPSAEHSQNDTGEQPPLLTQLVQKAGLSFDDFPFSQLVLVAADGSRAMIYCYNKSDAGLWQLDESTGYINGYIGRNGVSFEKREGDDATPAGLFNLSYAFGNRAKPSTGMEYREITKQSYWVDDPNSIYYNQWVEGTADADWSSAEHLSENINTYAYAVVVEYNTAPNTVAGNGSAIFLHCKNEPTSGCIAVSEEAILKILKWLSPDKSPSMLIAAQ